MWCGPLGCLFYCTAMALEIILYHSLISAFTTVVPCLDRMFPVLWLAEDPFFVCTAVMCGSGSQAQHSSSGPVSSCSPACSLDHTPVPHNQSTCASSHGLMPLCTRLLSVAAQALAEIHSLPAGASSKPLSKGPVSHTRQPHTLRSSES